MYMKSILIVAKEGDSRTELAAQLAREDYLVMTADDVRQAQEGLEGMLPGVILIDLPTEQQRRFVRWLVSRPALQMIPRFLVVAPLAPTGRPIPAAAAFVRPLAADHFCRALTALYPRGRGQVPAEAPQTISLAAAGLDLRKEERIRAGIQVVQSLPPPVLRLPPRPAEEGPSPRAVSVAHTFALESQGAGA